MEGELQDWELLHSADGEENSGGLDGISDDSAGNFMKDYFSLNMISSFTKSDRVGEEDPVESRDPSRMAPRSETLSEEKTLSELGHGSSINTAGEAELEVAGVESQLVFEEGEERQENYDRDGETEIRTSKPATSLTDEVNLIDSGVGIIENGRIGADIKPIGDIKDVNEESVDPPSGEYLVSRSSGDTEKGKEVRGDENVKEGDEIGVSSCAEDDSSVEPESGEENPSIIKTPATMSPAKSGNEEHKKGLIWWKVPFELLKYCVSRISPVWSISMAAAVMGFFILGRRLYSMKKKSQSLQLKVTFDDKKASQVMSRAARLNEAFSMVRRVPMIRPPSLALGLNSWPAMSLR